MIASTSYIKSYNTLVMYNMMYEMSGAGMLDMLRHWTPEIAEYNYDQNDPTGLALGLHQTLTHLFGNFPASINTAEQLTTRSHQDTFGIFTAVNPQELELKGWDDHRPVGNWSVHNIIEGGALDTDASIMLCSGGLPGADTDVLEQGDGQKEAYIDVWVLTYPWEWWCIYTKGEREIDGNMFKETKNLSANQARYDAALVIGEEKRKEAMALKNEKGDPLYSKVWIIVTVIGPLSGNPQGDEELDKGQEAKGDSMDFYEAEHVVHVNPTKGCLDDSELTMENVEEARKKVKQFSGDLYAVEFLGHGFDVINNGLSSPIVAMPRKIGDRWATREETINGDSAYLYNKENLVKMNEIAKADDAGGKGSGKPVGGVLVHTCFSASKEGVDPVTEAKQVWGEDVDVAGVVGITQYKNWYSEYEVKVGEEWKKKTKNPSKRVQLSRMDRSNYTITDGWYMYTQYGGNNIVVR